MGTYSRKGERITNGILDLSKSQLFISSQTRSWVHVVPSLDSNLIISSFQINLAFFFVLFTWFGEGENEDIVRSRFQIENIFGILGKHLSGGDVSARRGFHQSVRVRREILAELAILRECFGNGDELYIERMTAAALVGRHCRLLVMEGSQTKSKPDCRRAGHFYAFAFFSWQLLRKLLPLEPKRRWAEKKKNGRKGRSIWTFQGFSLFFYVCIRDCWWMVKSFHLLSPLGLFRGCGLEFIVRIKLKLVLFLMNGLLRKYVHTQRRPLIVHWSRLC